MQQNTGKDKNNPNVRKGKIQYNANPAGQNQGGQKGPDNRNISAADNGSDEVKGLDKAYQDRARKAKGGQTEGVEEKEYNDQDVEPEDDEDEQ